MRLGLSQALVLRTDINGHETDELGASREAETWLKGGRATAWKAGQTPEPVIPPNTELSGDRVMVTGGRNLIFLGLLRTPTFGALISSSPVGARRPSPLPATNLFSSFSCQTSQNTGLATGAPGAPYECRRKGVLDSEALADPGWVPHHAAHFSCLQQATKMSRRKILLLVLGCSTLSLLIHQGAQLSW